MLERLISIYHNWCTSEQLPLVSADELHYHVSLTNEQKTFLNRFIDCWDHYEGR